MRTSKGFWQLPGSEIRDSSGVTPGADLKPDLTLEIVLCPRSSCLSPRTLYNFFLHCTVSTQSPVIHFQYKITNSKLKKKNVCNAENFIEIGM